MKSFLSLFTITLLLLSGCKATFWYSPTASFHNTKLPEAATISIQAKSGIITLENGKSNKLTEIRKKGENQFEWSQRNDTLFISIPAMAENELEIAVQTDKNITILSESASINVIHLTNPMQVESRNSLFRFDQPPPSLKINSHNDSLFVGLSPDVRYNHLIEVDSSFISLIKNGNETEIHRIIATQDSSDNHKSAIYIKNSGESDIQVKKVGLIW